MRVIKRGILPSERKTEWTCGTCKSIVESTQNEGEYISDQREGDCVKFECPVCKRFNYVAVSRFK